MWVAFEGFSDIREGTEPATADDVVKLAIVHNRLPCGVVDKVVRRCGMCRCRGLNPWTWKPEHIRRLLRNLRGRKDGGVSCAKVERGIGRVIGVFEVVRFAAHGLELVLHDGLWGEEPA